MSFIQHYSPTEDRLTWAERPLSSTKQDAELIKRLSNRPASATRNFPSSKSGSLHRMKRPLQPDANTLSRLKPKHITMDKERLYEETLALKMEANYFREENLRLKTQMQQMEKELGRRDEFLEDLKTTAKEKYFGSSLQSSHLIANLKNSIKELKNELKQKEEENLKVKRDIRTSRLSELEVELHAYIDECTRLRHHLEEVMSKLTEQSLPDFNKIEQIVETLSEEKKKAEDALTASQQELEKAKKQIADLESKQTALQTHEISALKSEIQKLKSKLDLETDRKKARPSISEETRIRTELANTQKLLAESNEKQRNMESQLVDLRQELDVLKTIPVPERVDAVLSNKEIEKEEENSEDGDRAIIAAIETSPGEAWVRFCDKCAKAFSLAGSDQKIAIKSALAASPILDSVLFLALSEAGVETDLSEVQAVLTREEVLLDLKKMLESVPEKIMEESSSSSPNTFRVKEDVEHRIAPYFPYYKTPAEQSGDLSVVASPGAPVDKNVVVPILKALGFRLQLHRIPKNKLGSTLFGKNFNPNGPVTFQQLDKTLRGPPFNITNLEESALVARFALETEPKGSSCTAKDVVGKLFYVLEDWEVFTPSDESEFDKHISYLLTRSKAQFLDLCHLRDTENAGFISMRALREMCVSLSFDFDEREFHYMELLFFSLNFKLDQVPYQKLVQAYATDDSQRDEDSSQGRHSPEESVDEGERNTIVRGYIELMANELARKSLDVHQVFRSKDGILYPDKLVAGMRALGIPDMDRREMVVFLEALQCEDLDEYGIEMPLFEDILKGCKVGDEQEEKDRSQVSDGTAAGHHAEHSF